MTVPYQGYPPQPPQQPQYPQYPAQQPYPQQYAPPPQQGYPQQPLAPPAPPLAQGSLDDFYNQPSSGGGAGLKFSGPNNQPMVGKGYLFRVTRPLTAGDVQQQVDNQNRPLTFRDGRPKFVMIAPGELLQPDPAYPDNLCKWYVKSAARDELSRAMAETGAPEGPPEHDCVIYVELTGTRPSGPGMNPAHQFRVQYWRPGTFTGVQAAAPAPPAQYGQGQPQLPSVNHTPAPANYAPTAQHAPQGYGTQPQPAPQQYQQPAAPAPQQQYAPAPQQQVAQPPQAAPVPPAQPAPTNPQPPSDLSPEQQALLAQLIVAHDPAAQG